MNETGKTLPVTAAEVAKKRFEAYIAEKLRTEADETAWEFYTWLLKQAERRRVDRSGYAPFEYQADRDAVRKNDMDIKKELKDVIGKLAILAGNGGLS
jgi:hypothetical protein